MLYLKLPGSRTKKQSNTSRQCKCVGYPYVYAIYYDNRWMLHLFNANNMFEMEPITYGNMMATHITGQTECAGAHTLAHQRHCINRSSSRHYCARARVRQWNDDDDDDAMHRPRCIVSLAVCAAQESRSTVTVCIDCRAASAIACMRGTHCISVWYPCAGAACSAFALAHCCSNCRCQSISRSPPNDAQHTPYNR